MYQKNWIFLFLLNSPKVPIGIENIRDSIVNKDIPLTLDDINTFKKNNNEKNENKFYLKGYNLCTVYNGHEYQFEYNNYNKKLLNLINVEENEILESIKRNNIPLINFFDSRDIEYMKNLLKKILKSKLFREICQKYSKVEGIVNYYFEEEENIDDFLKRINFQKFREKKILVFKLVPLII